MTTQEFFESVSQSEAWQQLSPATHTKYLFWFRRYREFFCQNNVEELSTQQKLTQFLSQTAMETSANTKRQAISAIKWLYTHILHKEIAPPRITKARTLLHIFSKEKVALELSKLPIPYQFMGWLFYGSGLTLREAMTLKHKQIIASRIHLGRRVIPLELLLNKKN